MRPTTDFEAEARVLTTEGGRALLAEAARVAAPGPHELTRWRRTHPAEVVSAAVRMADARRRGAAKFARADRMWLDPTGLEQATAEQVARHKALRFAGALVVDLCCGIGGDALALASQSRVLAIDSDQGMCRRTRWNAAVYEVAAQVSAIQARAERFPLPRDALVHIDPDRRSHPGGRARDLDRYFPGLDAMLALSRAARGGAIKLGPASDFAEHFDGEGREIELVSLNGECKEATVWFGALATCRRRATALPEGETWTDRDGPNGVAPVVEIARYVFDPDPALVRAGLLDSFAVAHGLGRCAPRVDFLTGPQVEAASFLTAFEVVDVLPLDMKALRRLVAARGLGPLEIKSKGLDLRPEVVRAALRPPGPHPATLLLVGGPGRARAIVARRVV